MRFEKKTAIVPIFANGIDGIFALEKCRIYFISATSEHPLDLYFNSVLVSSGTDHNATDIASKITWLCELINVKVDGAVIPCIKFKNNVRTRVVSNSDVSEIDIEYICDNKYKKKKVETLEQIDAKEKIMEVENDKVMKEYIVKQLRMGNSIWEEAKGSKNSDAFKELSEELQLRHFQQKHTTFNKQHPLVLRYMIQFHSYSSKAFEKYLNRVVLFPGGNPEQFMELQADYAVFLYKELNPRNSGKISAKVRTETLDMLKAEDESFKKNQDEAEELGQMVNSRYSHQRRVELQRFVEKIRESNKSVDEFLIRSLEDIRLEDAIKKSVAGKSTDADPDSDSCPEFDEPSKKFLAD